jgi:small subunit ribosomal protein S2
VQLYARAAADAVLEGKAAAPNSAAVREEEFVEGDGKAPRGRAPAKKAAPAKPAAKADGAGEGLARAEAEVAENEAVEKKAAE